MAKASGRPPTPGHSEWGRRGSGGRQEACRCPSILATGCGVRPSMRAISRVMTGAGAKAGAKWNPILGSPVFFPFPRSGSAYYSLNVFFFLNTYFLFYYCFSKTISQQRHNDAYQLCDSAWRWILPYFPHPINSTYYLILEVCCRKGMCWLSGQQIIMQGEVRLHCGNYCSYPTWCVRPKYP